MGKTRFLSSRVIVVLFILLACVSGALFWIYFLQERVIPQRWGVVEDGLIYRSAQLPPGLLKKIILKNRIQCIIDLTWPDPDDSRQTAEKKIAAELGVEYKNFPMYGSGLGSDENYVGAIIAIIRAKQEQKPVLVHCVAGTQRTGGVIAAYRLLIQNAQATTVRAEMMRYGWDPLKDRQLADFLNERLKHFSALLRAEGVYVEEQVANLGTIASSYCNTKSWFARISSSFCLIGSNVPFPRMERKQNYRM